MLGQPTTSGRVLTQPAPAFSKGLLGVTALKVAVAVATSVEPFTTEDGLMDTDWNVLLWPNADEKVKPRIKRIRKIRVVKGSPPITVWHPITVWQRMCHSMQELWIVNLEFGQCPSPTFRNGNTFYV